MTVPEPAESAGPAGLAAATSVDAVVALFERWGAERYDEEVSQLEHALQVAALARRDGASDELVAAALLHDVGHLLELAQGRSVEPVDRRHEVTGPAYLSRLFGPGVTGPIELHVRAKRYLCAVEPDHAARLSPGSVASLAKQGGALDPAEAAAFAATPGALEAVALRRWDDEGKVRGLDVGDLERHRELLHSVARRS